MASTKQYTLEGLEPRILLSGDVVAAGLANLAVVQTLTSPSVVEEITLEATSIQTEENASQIENTATSDTLFEGVETQLLAPENSVELTTQEGGLIDAEGEANSGSASENAAAATVATGVLVRTSAASSAQPTISSNAESMASQLTETLHAANSPPSSGSSNLFESNGLSENQSSQTTAESPASSFPSSSENLVNSGTYRPGGNVPGTENISDFTQTATGITIIQIGTPVSDRVNVTTTANFDGTLKIELYGGYVPALNDTFDIFTYASHEGEFANWLGTASIPGHNDWSFKPEYLGDRLRLTVVQTPLIAPVVGGYIDSGLATLANVGNFINGIGEFAESLPFIGSQLGSLVDVGQAIQDAIWEQVNDLLNLGPRISRVTNLLESLNGTTVLGFTITVNGVLAHYGTTNSEPFWWDANIKIAPTAVNRALENVTGAVLDAVFSGAPSVQVTSGVTLDFGFGYDTEFFATVDSIKAEARVNATGMSGFGFNFSVASLNVTNGSVDLMASVTAVPDASILTGGRISQTTLNSLNNNTSVSDAFNLTKAGTLDASFTLAGALSGFAFNYTGTHTVRVQSSDLFSGEDPDLTVVVNGTMNILGQRLSGIFTMKKTATETVLEMANVELILGLGIAPGQIQLMRLNNGSGKFLLINESDLAGSATLTIAEGPEIAGLVNIDGTTLTLTLNTSDTEVATIDGETVNLPAGDYYRVEGHAIIGLAVPDIELTGDFVFEPRNTDGNPANGDEEIVVGVANLSFSFDALSTEILSVTNGSGAFVITDDGLSGWTTATVGLSLPGISLIGPFTVAVNTQNTSFSARTVNVNGTTVAVPSLPAGPYLKVEAGKVGQLATLTVLGISMTGRFGFEQKTTTPGSGSEKVVTIIAQDVSFDLGSAVNDILTINAGSAHLLLTSSGIAGKGQATANINIGGVSLTATVGFRINETNTAVNETVDFNGVNETLQVPQGPYLQVTGNDLNLSVYGVTLTGDFSFEQRTTPQGSQLVVVRAENVAFDFGIDLLQLNNGSALFIITDTGMAGQGSIDVTISAFGESYTQPVTWDFNNTGAPIDQTVGAGPGPNVGSGLVGGLTQPPPAPIGSSGLVDDILQELDLPEGPYNRFSTGGPVGFSFDVGGSPQSMSAALVLTLVNAEGSNPAYVTVGISQFSMTLGTGAVGLQVADGTGAFVIYESGVAGEVTVGSVTLNGPTGLTDVLSVSATDLKVRFNNTGHAIGPLTVSVSDNSADDVTITFPNDADYFNYLAISGLATITVELGPVTIELGGNFAFKKLGSDELQIGAEDLHFDLVAGSATVAAFRNGIGGFVITGGGFAGVADLDFEAGLIGISGNIKLEVNTTSINPITRTVDTGGMTPVNFTISRTNYFGVVVDGQLLLGAFSLPLDFRLEVDTATGEFLLKNLGGTTLLKVTATGQLQILDGSLSATDFAKAGPYEWVSMLRQLASWISTFRDASVFDFEIPFTGGTTLGDAFDWTQLFLDKIFSKMISVELAATALRASSDPDISGSITNGWIRLKIGDDPVVQVNLTASYNNSDDNLTELENAFNNAGGALAAAGIANKVEARINPDGQFVLALKPDQIAAGKALSIVGADAQMAALGFGQADSTDTTVEAVAIENARYSTEDFFVELGNLLGLTVAYNEAQRVYSYLVDFTGIAGATYTTSLPFNLGGSLGPIAGATLGGTLDLTASVGFKFNLGFDLTAREVPRMISNGAIPVPANGRISADAHFELYLNGDTTIPALLTLPKSYTDGTDPSDLTPNQNVRDLAADLNRVFRENNIMFNGVSSQISQLVYAQKAGSGLAISGLMEDYDGDGVLNTTSEDTNGNSKLDAGEDLDGDGKLDRNEDLNGDGNLDNMLGVVNRITLKMMANDTFATELGFGAVVTGSTPADAYFIGSANYSMKGLFIDDVRLEAELAVTNSTPITGSLRLGFVEVTTSGGSFGTLNYEGTTAQPITANITLQDQTTGETRYYLSELFGGTSSVNIGNLMPAFNFTGSFLARLADLQIHVGGANWTSLVMGGNREISLWIPDITNLNFNSETYNGANKGIFVTYPQLGNFDNFGSLNFTKIIQAINIVADSLSQLSAFSFLDERLPFIDISINDMIDYASKFAELVEAVGNTPASSLQASLASFEEQVETLFNLNPNVFQVVVDNNGILPTSLMTGSGTAGSPSRTTINPNGDNNAFEIRATTNGTTLNGSVIKIVGDSAVTGSGAQASWDATRKILTIKINPGVTTANGIAAALAGTPWTANIGTVPDNSGGTNTGNGTLVTTALKFSFDFTTAYANTFPFALDLKKLVQQLGGTSPAVAAFLEAATTLIQIEGSGVLTVSASASLRIAFGLDLTNPNNVRPFFYDGPDGTGATLLAKVLGTDIELQASLGAVVGIFIKDGSITLDKDGDPATTAANGDRGAEFRLGLRDNNGDGRHYFSENWFNFDNIDLSLTGGASARLPIFAPFEGTALSGEDDNNADGIPDNQLFVDIPDIVRFFVDSRAVGGVADVRLPGANNNLRITKNVGSSIADNFKVVFIEQDSVGTGANATYSNGTLTVYINSDATTVSAIKTAVQSQNFTATDLADQGTAPGTGKATVSKLVLTTPDFSSLFDGLELCELIASNTGVLLNGLDTLLKSIQDGLNAVVLNTNLPLIGDGLSGAANFIEDFRNGLLADLRKRVEDAGGNGLVALENAIKEAFWNTLGPGGLDLLVNAQTGEDLDPALGYSQLEVTLDCDDGLLVKLRLKKEAGLIDTTQNPIDVDIGIPGFGLQVDGNVSVKIGFDLKFGFGLNKEDGFFFDTTATGTNPELRIYLEAAIPSLHVGGTLLFLQLDISDDDEEPTLVAGQFVVDLKDPNNDGKLTFSEMGSSGVQFDDIIDFDLELVADLNLDLIASFGGDTAFPRILAEFHLDWSWSLDEGASDPVIAFTDIYLDLGTFISEFLNPILKEIRKITEPIDPIIEIVTTPIPVISDLAGEPITFLDLAEIFGLLEPSTVKFIQSVLDVISLINDLEGIGEGSILIPFGAFSLGQDETGRPRNIQPLTDVANQTMDDIQAAIDSASGPGVSESYKSATSGFMGDVGSMDNFKIPIFDNPAELFNLFVGDPVRLVEWRMPTFKFEFTYTQKIPIYPPLYAQFGGKVGAEINIGFGYDTYGIQKFIASEDKNWVDILDGFYIIDWDANGNERPELKLYGEIFAGASISLLMVEAGVRGGVGFTLEFDLNDINDDGKIRVSELIANAQLDPRCIFDIYGRIYLFLEAYLIVDLFFFSIDKTWRFAEITLFEFTITCPEPVLAGPDASGNLVIHAGVDAGKRAEIDTNDNAETFIVKHAGFDGADEKVEVQWGNYKQEFTVPSGKRIIVNDAGQGDDHLDFRGVQSPVTVNGGVGNDTIFLSDGADSEAHGGDGNDTITASSAETATNARIYGDAGNDILTAGIKAIFIDGGAGNDTITGSPESDGNNALTLGLFGGGGQDLIRGNDGDDYLDGGDGNDQLYGGPGLDLILGGAGADIIFGERGNDIVDGGAGDDQISGGEGNDLLVGGDGDDKVYGHGGIDLIVGDQVGTVNNIAVTYANRESLATAVTNIEFNGITLKNITGFGNDFLVGGGNIDVIFGGAGDDFLYGGNFLQAGVTEVIEEDHNDFFDGGPGNDVIFGDDSMGRAGDRNTGISIKSSIWYDGNMNGLRDEGELGFGGVRIELRKWSLSDADPALAVEETEPDGSFEFVGLDPGDYYLKFELPTGLAFTGRYKAEGATKVEDSDLDSDVDDDASDDVPNPLAHSKFGETGKIVLSYSETETKVAAGYTGPAKVSLTDQSVQEGNSGVVQVTFTITLSGIQGYPVQIEYRTKDGNSTDPFRNATSASGDYVPVPNTVLTFQPGELVKSITLTVNSDTTYEQHEQFELEIVRAQRMDPGSPFDLQVTDSQVLVTIINDDPIPTLNIRDFLQEGVDDDNDPLTPPIFVENKLARFLVTLSNPSQYSITVQWRTDFAWGPTLTTDIHPADPGADFLLNSGTLTFAPGVTSQTINVTVFQDTLDEYDEVFFVDLYNSAYAQIGDGRAHGVIADDDDPVSVTIVPVNPIGGPFTTEVLEGNYGDHILKFEVRLQGPTGLLKPSGKTVTVNYATAPGTAVEMVYSELLTDFLIVPDYQASPNSSMPEELQSLVFAPGETVKTIEVTINNDPWVEGELDPDNPANRIEYFFVNLIGVQDAEIARRAPFESNHVTVKIIDDDLVSGDDYGPWNVWFSDTEYVVQEPKTGDTIVNVTIIRSPGSSNSLAVFYTLDGTATADTTAIQNDYKPVFRELVRFADNELVKTIPIVIHSDGLAEGTETIKLYLRNPTGGPVNGRPDEATIKILDGNTPEMFILDRTITEGSGGGTQMLTFRVYLRDPDTFAWVTASATNPITVYFNTQSLTARAGEDFNYTANTLTFTNLDGFFKEIQVPIIRDNTPELSERFAIRLTNPTNATIAKNGGVAIGTINDDDKIPVFGIVFYDTNGNGYFDVSEKGLNGVQVDLTYETGTGPVTENLVTGDFDTNSDGILEKGVYHTSVLLGQLNVIVHGENITSPYKGLFLFGTGTYETTTSNESQTIKYQGIVGLTPFEDVGYKIVRSFALPAEDTKDVGRGGTDDTIFGGPGNDTIDAGAGDDHVVGGHWLTATDGNLSINKNPSIYDAVITVLRDEVGDPNELHPVYDNGPIFAVDTSALGAGGSISGQVFIDLNNNGRQDFASERFTTLPVVVHLYDCDGNLVNSTLMIMDGLFASYYLFTGLAQPGPGEEATYVVQFELPKGYTFISPDLFAPATVNSDVIVGGRTTLIKLTDTDYHIVEQDAGIKLSDAVTTAGPGQILFTENSYSVSESTKTGVVTVAISRFDSTAGRPVVIRTEGLTAQAGVNFESVYKLIYFEVGEAYKLVDIPIIDTNSLGFCVDPLIFKLVLRDVTGRPLDVAVVYIGGESYGSLTDDDVIFGGADWDIILGDSGNIPAATVIDPTPEYNNLGGIVRNGGPGKDIIYGGGGPDWIDAQHHDDIIDGGEGNDEVMAGLGNDVIYAYIDNDNIHGGFGYDTVISNRDVPVIELRALTPTTAVLMQKAYFGQIDFDALSTFSLTEIESARMFGGPYSNIFDIQSWNGGAFIAGAGGSDTLLVNNDTNMILKDATALDYLFSLILYGFGKDASISLSSGQTYHLSSLEKVTLTGGIGNNTFNAAGYSRPVTMVGKAGNDILIGGSANDVFVFDVDESLGTDTVIGNGGIDTLDFSLSSTGIIVNLSQFDPINPVPQTVAGVNLRLDLKDAIEKVIGGSGDDDITGNDLDNILIGGPGNDRLAGGKGSERYIFDTDEQWDIEEIVEHISDPGHDILDFSGTASRSININMSLLGVNQVVNDHLTIRIVGEGIEEIIGGSKNDTIRGNSNNNILRGGPGNDLLDGKSGDDILDGGPGNDDLNGGPGTDSIFETANTNFTLSNSQLIRSNGEVDQLNNIEVAHLRGGVSPNTFDLTGWTGTGSIDGGDDPNQPRTDTVIMAADADFILTNTKLDVSTNFAPISLKSFVRYLPSPVFPYFTISIVPSIDVAILTGGSSGNLMNASGFSGRVTLIGNEGDDTLIGGSGPDRLYGGLGNDTLRGNRSNDLIDGGLGNDTLIEDLSAVSRDVKFTLTNNGLLIVQPDTDGVPPDTTITEFDNLLGIEAVSLTGSPQNDTFDVTAWTLGQATLNGGAGQNLILATATSNGTITLTNTALTFTGGAASFSFTSIQGAMLTGSAGDDVLDASLYDGIAYLQAMGGNDIIKAGRGLNAILGGDGDDTIIFRQDGEASPGGNLVYIMGGDGVDTLDFSGFTANLQVNLAATGANQTVVNNELKLYLLAEDLENVIGGSGHDTLLGNDLDNTFTGGLGNDLMRGFGGINTVVETADANMTLTDASLVIGGNTDTLLSINRAILTGGAGNNKLDAAGFTGSVTLIGGAGDDELIGGSGNDILIGGAGNDKLAGNAGSDSYRFDVDEALGEDTIEESSLGTGGQDILDFSATTTVGVNVDLGNIGGAQTVHATNLKLTINNATSLEHIIGGEMNDVLVGNSLNNQFWAKQGDDTIKGGGGSDYVVEMRDGDFTLTETVPGDATLTINFLNGAVAVTEADHLTDIGQVFLVGGDGHNTLDASGFVSGMVTLFGMAGNDILIGGYRDDTLRGGDGNDQLFGGAGIDQLYGDAGNDTLNGAGNFDPNIAPDDDDNLFGGAGNDTYIFDQSFYQGLDTVTERWGEGFADTLLGIGASGTVMPSGNIFNRYSTAVQVISANLSIQLIYPNPLQDLGQVEFSF